MNVFEEEMDEAVHGNLEQEEEDSDQGGGEED